MSKRSRILWIVVSLALIGPAIASDFMNDDYFFNSPLLEPDRPFGYYDFLPSRDLPTVPWWAAEGFKVRFFRPLASLALHLDFTVSPDNALFGHLHSAVWLVVLLLGAFALFDRILDVKARRWAAPIFAMGLFTAWAAGWISARHAIMGGAFAVWATVVFADGLRTGSRVRYAVSSLLFILGLLSSESALAFAAAAFFLSVREKPTWVERLCPLIAPAAVSLAYLAVYNFAGFGSHESDLYLNPVDTPGAYLAGLPSKMLALLGSFTFGIPAMLRIMPKLEPVTVLGGVAALLFLGGATLLRWSGFDDARKRNLRLLWIAVPVTALPEMAGMVEGRGSLLSAVLFSALAATILQGTFAKEGALRPLRRVVGVVLFAGLLVFSPLSRLAAAAFIHMGAANLVKTGGDSDTGCEEGQNVYQINADSLMAVMSPFIVARAKGAFFGEWNQLGQAQRDLTLTRTGEDTLRLEAADGVVESYLWLFRRQESSWNEGTPVKKGSLEATVVETEANVPTVVEFRISGLSGNNACLVRAEGFLLKNQTIPEIGESVVVPWVPPLGP